MNVQPVEETYYFTDTVFFRPTCDSISYAYNCGPCLDEHIGQVLSDRWYATGNERYVEPREWVMKLRGSEGTRYELRTVTILRTPGEEICGRMIHHLSVWSKEERKSLRRAVRKQRRSK
ncbi:MAG TPA: hypothetical protein VGE21_00775 [Flavobacteriales bacterium]